MAKTMDVVNEVGEVLEGCDTPAEWEASSVNRMPDNVKRFLIRMQGGKLYLPAAYRLVWFRDLHPDWGIETKLIEGGQEAGIATVQARIYNAEGKIISSGIKTETRQDFPAGWVEKAETGAIARALAVAGYGTQFGDELEDGASMGRLADSPIAPGGGLGSYQAPRSGERESTASKVQRELENRGVKHGNLNPADFWPGPGQCPTCHAPEGKRHGKPCTS